MLKIKFFSSLRELCGKAETELPFQSVLSLSQVWQRATDGQEMPSNTLCAINMEYARLDDMVHDGDEIAFFPPVTGG